MMNTKNMQMLKIMKGTIQLTLTSEAFDTVLTAGVDAESNVRMGTNIGGTLMNYSWKLWLPDALAGLILL